MKVKTTFWCMMFGGSFLFASCLSELKDLEPKNASEESETGVFILDLNTEASFDIQTRALNEANYRDVSNYTVELYKNGEVTPFETFNMSRSSTTLPITVKKGAYWARAYFGAEHPASQDEFLVEGRSQSVQVNPDAEQTIPITCTPTCGKVLVNFGDDMPTYYESYSVDFGGTQALGNNTFTWTANNNTPWYVAVGENGETVNYTIHVKAKSQYVHVSDDGIKHSEGTATGTFTLNRNRSQLLTIHPSFTATEDGWLQITITIDDTTNDAINKTFTVPVSWIK